MIFKGSRYEQLAGSVITATTADGTRQVALPIRFIPRTAAVFRHTASASDRLDLLAYHFYEDQQRWWLSADANMAIDPDDLLEPGREILVPPEQRR